MPLILTPPVAFGELALLYKAQRDATMIATSAATVWSITRKDYMDIMLITKSKLREEYKTALHSVPILSSLDDAELGLVSDRVLPCNFEAGDTIVRKGDPATTFYFINKGTVKCTKIDTFEDVTLGPGSYFGELGLLNNTVRKANVLAVTRCECLALEKDSFDKVLGSLREVLSVFGRAPRHPFF